MSQPAATLPYFSFKPHSITDRDWWNRAASDARTQPALKMLLDHRRDAKGIIPHPLASDFLAARRSNDRGILDRYWLESRMHLSSAVIARCVHGDISQGVDDHLLNSLWSFLTCPTWVVSAHLPNMDLPLTSAPQMDLAACEMAANLAETLEVLKPWIDNQSKTLADSIIYEIDRRVLTPFAQDEVLWWWYDPKSRWNNWAGVCAGSILAACEAFAVLGQPRPKARDKAIEVLNQFLHRGFTKAGECDEGIGYWGYGLGYGVLGWSRLSENEFRSKVDIKRLNVVSDYPRRVHLFDDWFYSGNDAPLRSSAAVFAAAWLSGATGSSWMTAWTRQGTAVVSPRKDTAVALRVLDALLRVEPGEPSFPTPESSRYLEDQQTAIFTNGRLTISFSGGNNEECHNHNDIGHFNVWVGRELIVPDLGAPQYTSDFFGAKRYEYLSASSRGHCCPIINGVDQRVGPQAQAVVIENDSTGQRLAMDCTTAYPEAAKLRKWVRSVEKSGTGYQLKDTFTTSEPVEIENVVWLLREPKISGSTVVAGPLTLKFDASAMINYEPVDPKPHRLRDFTEMMYRVSARYRTAASTTLQATIEIVAS